MVMGGDVGSAGGSEKPNGTPHRFDPWSLSKAGITSGPSAFTHGDCRADGRTGNAADEAGTTVAIREGYPSSHPITSRKCSGASRRFASLSMIHEIRAASFA